MTITQTIQERREYKASVMAFLAWSAEIPAAAMERAQENEWLQLTEAARVKMQENFGPPSIQTRRMVVKMMWEFQKRECAA